MIDILIQTMEEYTYYNFLNVDCLETVSIYHLRSIAKTANI